MLDSQRQVNKTMAESYGTMTNVEKQLNKADLHAYKVFDARQYSLVPGVTKSPLRDSAVRSTPDITGTKELNKSYDYSRAEGGHSNLALRGAYFPSVRDYQGGAPNKP